MSPQVPLRLKESLKHFLHKARVELSNSELPQQMVVVHCSSAVYSVDTLKVISRPRCSILSSQNVFKGFSFCCNAQPGNSLVGCTILMLLAIVLGHAEARQIASVADLHVSREKVNMFGIYFLLLQ